MEKRKKLLILGATSETAKMVITAEQMGIETYVVDPIENAPAKKYASNALNMDCFDIEGICNIIKDNNIDGVLPGCADILIPVYEQVCRELGKFCYVNKMLTETFNNKKGLKEALLRNGMCAIKDYSVEEVLAEDFDAFPLFTKPVDNNSSKGMSIVYEKDCFKEAYDKAISFSKSNTVLIEDYKTCDDFYIGYFAQDGNISVAFTGDRYVINQPGVGSITSAIVYPSKYTDLYFSTIHEKMVKLFDELDFKNGICAIQGFVEDGKIMFYDPALRITGGQEYVLIKHFSGLDELENLISFAVDGKMLSDEEYKKCDATWGGAFGCNLTFSVKACELSRIAGIDFARNRDGVINITQEHDVGDVIDRIGTAQQNIARMHIVAKNAKELKNLIVDLQNHIVAYGKQGEDVMLKGFDAEAWYKDWSE